MKTTQHLIASPALFDALNAAGVLESTPDNFMGYDIGAEGYVIAKLKPRYSIACDVDKAKSIAIAIAAKEGLECVAVPAEWWEADAARVATDVCDGPR